MTSDSQNIEKPVKRGKKGNKSVDWALQFRRMVPGGPYASESEKYDAVSKYEDYIQHCKVEGEKEPSINKVKAHMKMTMGEIKRVATSLQYKEMRMAGAKVTIGVALADMAPLMKEHLSELMTSAQGGKEKKEALELLLKLAEKYGLYDIDINKSNVGEELDTDACIDECLKIIEQVTGQSVVIQKFCKAVKEGANSTNGGNEETTAENVNSDEPVADGGVGGPDGSLEASSSPEEVVVQSKEISSDDWGKPPGQDGLVDG